MAAYVLVNVDVHDPVAYQEYATQVPPTLQLYGGRFLVRGGAIEPLEGEHIPKRLIALEFESVEAAKRWYHSPEYQAIIGLRHAHSTADFMLIVDGIPQP